MTYDPFGNEINENDMKENSAHSFTEGYELSDKDKLDHDRVVELEKRLDEIDNEMHNKIMVQWEKDFGSIHNEQKMDAYTVSGFIKNILEQFKASRK